MERPDALHLVRPAAPGDPPCERCTAKCCRYVAIEIDRPRNARDFDQIRWYLLHDGIVVWVQDGSWHVEFRAACRSLLPDGRCGTYDTRPQLCRDYGHGETSRCDFWSSPADFELLFEDAASFEAWVESERERRTRRRDAARRRRAAAVGAGA